MIWNKSDDRKSSKKAAFMIVTLILVSLSMTAFQGVVVEQKENLLETSDQLHDGWSEGETRKYEEGFQDTVDLDPGIYEIEVHGASGAGTTSASGGDGAYVMGTFEANQDDELELWVGERGDTTSGGWGYKDGGDGAQVTIGGERASGGGGGGSTRVEYEGEKMIDADAGGGAGDERTTSVTLLRAPGGGGGRGGEGGSGGTDGSEGEDASGTGEGGDGGGFSDDDHSEDGGDGGYSYSNFIEVESAIKGGSDYHNGYVEITMEKRCGVTVNSQSNTTISDHDGDEYTYEAHFDIENTGSLEETYDLSGSPEKEGWSATPHEDSITIPEGDEKTVYVDVDIPGDAGGESSEIKLEADGMSRDTDSFTLSVEKYHDLEVTSPEDQEEKESGNVSYTFSVENAGNTEDEYSLSVEEIKDWSVSISGEKEISVEAGQNKDVEITLKIPSDAGGITNTVTLSAQSQGDETMTASDSMDVYLEPVVSFSVDVDDIKTGENPSIEITEAKYDDGNSVQGEREVETEIDDFSLTESIDFDHGGATYLWDEELTETGQYDAEVMIDGIEETDDFWVGSGDVEDFDLDVENIEAGEEPVVSIEEAEDEYGNLIEGEYTVTIEINDDQINKYLYFEEGSAESSWDEIYEAGDYTSEVTIDEVLRYDSFIVEPAQASYFEFEEIEDQKIYETFEITIKAYDEHGNLATGYEKTVELMDTTETISPDEVTFSDGKWIGEVTITEAEVEVTITAKEGERSGESNEFEVIETYGEIEGTVYDEEGYEVDHGEAKLYGDEDLEDLLENTQVNSHGFYGFDTDVIVGEEYWVKITGVEDHLNGSGSLLIESDTTHTLDFHLDQIEIDELEITEQPTLTYDSGDELELEGMVITEHHNDGTAEEVTYGDNIWIEYYSAEPSSGSILEDYHDGEAVEVIHKDGFLAETDPLTVYTVIDYIEVTEQPRLEYISGEELDLTDLVVTEYYTDDSSVLVEFTDGVPENYTSTPVDGIELDGEYHGESIMVKHDDIDEKAETDSLTIKHELKIDTIGEGHTEPDEGIHFYEHGTELSIIANPEDGWYFVEWIGLESEDEDVRITINEDKEVTAVFEEDKFTLDLTVQGEGEVDVDPVEEKYEGGTTINLTAIPEEKWYFVNWTGDHQSENRTIKITIESDLELTVNFEEGDAVFEVEIESFEEEIAIGEELRLEYSVMNTGGIEGTQEIVFRVRGVNIEVVEVSLGGGEEFHGEFSMEIRKARFDDGGEFDFQVLSEDEVESVSIVVGDSDQEDVSSLVGESSFFDYWWLALVIIPLLVASVLLFRRSKRSGGDGTVSKKNGYVGTAMNDKSGGRNYQLNGDVTSAVENVFRELGSATEKQAYQKLTSKGYEDVEIQKVRNIANKLVKEEKLTLQPRRDSENLFVWNER